MNDSYHQRSQRKAVSAPASKLVGQIFSSIERIEWLTQSRHWKFLLKRAALDDSKQTCCEGLLWSLKSNRPPHISPLQFHGGILFHPRVKTPLRIQQSCAHALASSTRLLVLHFRNIFRGRILGLEQEVSKLHLVHLEDGPHKPSLPPNLKVQRIPTCKHLVQCGGLKT